MPPVPSHLPSRVSRRRERGALAVVGAFESETQAVIVRTTPASEHLILYVLAAMLALAAALISVTKLDRVVTGTGRIVPSAGTLFVQPFDKAIVRDIRVRAGEVVKKGQVLATLDPTFASADLNQLQKKEASGSALVARLAAEHAARPFAPADDENDQALQSAIWQQRQSEYRSSLEDFDQRIRNSEATIARLHADVATYNERLGLAAQVEQMRVALERAGWGSRLNTIVAADSRAEIDRLMSDTHNQIAETQHTLDSLKAQRAVFIDRWHSQISWDLAAARDTLAETQDQLKKAEKLHQLVSLVAPADSVVLKIGKASIGSVADEQAVNAEPLFTLVPIDGNVEAEVDIPAQDIGFIRAGDRVEIKFEAYRFLQHGTAKGVIKTISEGSFTVGENNEVQAPYFKSRIAFTEVHLRNVPASFRLIPGMTLTADVIVGKRTILSYLVEGALRTGSEAMREP